jgi:glycosyltransferase involved in cell wall biosynthesis
VKISVIISTYNQPEWLAKTLHGYLYQTFTDFEVLIADDGSGEETRRLIDGFREISRFPIQHVWQEDEGFQKCRILNKATVAATGNYLVYSDGDCIPRPDFLAVHARCAAPGHFLSGGYCKLPMDLSQRLTLEDIELGRAFDLGFLREHGLKEFSPIFKIGLPAPLAGVMDVISPTKASWNGHSASGWKADILAINGYNEVMQYGGEDRELGERLTNAGITGRRIRHRAILLHLDHKRGYRTQESIDKNRAIRDRVVATHSIWCPHGIEKRPHP